MHKPVDSPAATDGNSDLQHGIHERRAAVLTELLFSQRCKVFALLDAARDSHVIHLLEHGDCAYACLYKGQAAATYKAYAPYLVRPEREARVTHSLLAHGSDVQQGMGIGPIGGRRRWHC